MTLALTKRVIILDASCVINLYATGRIEEILKSIKQSVAASVYVIEHEANWIRKMVEGNQTKHPIDLTDLIESGLLTIVDIEGESESILYLSLSRLIRDEGESQTGAIAVERGWAVGLDDRKARRILQETDSSIEMVYTLELIKHWVDVESIPNSIVKDVLVAIQQYARYVPRKANPLYQWWFQIVEN